MYMTGMIFQYNSDNGSGLLMLSDGDSKQFDRSQWQDDKNEPSVGLKISYEERAGVVTVCAYDESKQEENEEQDIEQYIQEYLNEGFNLVKDAQKSNKRTVVLRKYDKGDFGEITLESSAGKVSIEKMFNGKKVD